MNPRQYQKIIGFLFLLIGILGFFIWGPTATDSLFGVQLFYNVIESWSLVILGAVALLVGYFFPAALQKWATLTFTALLIFVGTYAFFAEDLFGAALQNPADGIIYLVLGFWGLLLVAFNKPKADKKAL